MDIQVSRCGVTAPLNSVVGTMIYFVQGDQTRRIKIGFTKGFIHSRIRALQTGSPDKLAFIGACLGDKRAENELHFIFRKYHSHGEWFHDSPKLRNYIKKHCVHDMDIAHDIDSLVSDEGENYEFLRTLDYKEIKSRYASYLVKKLEQSDLGRRQIAALKHMHKDNDHGINTEGEMLQLLEDHNR